MSGSAPERKPVAEAGDAAGQTQKVSKTPPKLLALGIGDGEWQFITKPQLKGLNREEQPPHVRVWAVGMLHSVGYQEQCAVKEIQPRDRKPYHEVLGTKLRKQPDGSVAETLLVPMAPSDIAREAGLSLPETSKAINKLEKCGLAEQTGDEARKIRVTFFAKPKAAFTAPCKNSVDESDNRNLKLSDAATIALAASLRRKIFSRVPQSSLCLRPDLVANPEYRIALESALGEWFGSVVVPGCRTVVNGINQSFPLENHSVVNGTGAYKEESSSESIKDETSTSAAAAVPSPTINGKTQKRTLDQGWLLTLASVRAQGFPEAGIRFLQNLLPRCLTIRPGLTDAELASCMKRAENQKTAGLYLDTVPNRVEALNSGMTDPGTSLSLAERKRQETNARIIANAQKEPLWKKKKN